MFPEPRLGPKETLAEATVADLAQSFALPTGLGVLGDIFAEFCFFLDDYYLQLL